MELFNQNFLTILTFAPLVWGLLGLMVPAKSGKNPFFKNWAWVGSLLVFILSLKLYFAFEASGPAFQLMESHTWIPALGASYLLGVDGLSLWLVLLTTFLMPIIILGSFTAVQEREKEFYFYLQALQTGMIGAFVSLDLFLFYIFWEIMLVPMYFLIGVWGGKNRTYATMKFFIYTLAGSLLMLVAIFYLAYQHQSQFGSLSTSLIDLYKLSLPGGSKTAVQSILFLAFAIAFAIKVPLFPLHTWLPDAHVEAPTAGSVVLAGVLLKMGGYGFVRFAFPLFPDAIHQYQWIFLFLGSVAIVYGAWIAMVQPDIKKLVAYSSVSHMGYVVVGLFSLNEVGATGAMYQMLNHGVSTGALFLLVGMIYERRHTRQIEDFGGIAKVMPIYAIAFLIVTMSSVALPGTNGFVGEFLILLGMWQANKILTVVATTGVVFGAVYMLWMFRRVLFGPLLNPENKTLQDIGLREKFVLAPLILAIFLMGIFPNFFFSKMEPSIERLLQQKPAALKLVPQQVGVKS